MAQTSFGRHLLELWMLDPAVTYLNHGTVGAVPRQVLRQQQAIRDEIERRPADVLLRDVSHIADPSERAGPTRMRQAAAAVAAHLGASGDDLVFTDNVTVSIHTVLRSMRLSPGDEMLLLDHAYGTNALLFDEVAREAGAVVRRVTVPYPAFDPAALIDGVTAALTERTRIALIDHVTSESALVLPLADIAARCRARGVPVLGDGAHAPGMLPVDIAALGVDWYAANLHKWAFAPRSCGILWARPDRQAALRPPIVSWGFEQGFPAAFDWPGTRDPSPWLAAPEGFAFLAHLGADAARRYMNDLAWHAAVELTRRWHTPLERDASTIASMVTLPLPPSLGSTLADAIALRTALLREDAIEVQTSARAGRLWVRVSIQVYNDRQDIERLGEAIASRA